MTAGTLGLRVIIMTWCYTMTIWWLFVTCVRTRMLPIRWPGSDSLSECLRWYSCDRTCTLCYRINLCKMKQKKSTTLFYWSQINEGEVIICSCRIRKQCWKSMCSSAFSHGSEVVSPAPQFQQNARLFPILIMKLFHLGRSGIHSNWDFSTIISPKK